MDVNTNERFTVGLRGKRYADNQGCGQCGYNSHRSKTARAVATDGLYSGSTANNSCRLGSYQAGPHESRNVWEAVRLASIAPGWRGPGAQSMKVSSLNRFLHFWSLIRDDAVEPELALAPDGSIHAEWFKSLRQRLDIRFTDPNVRFGMFTNNNILEGADKLSTVAQILKDHHAKPLTWQPK